MKIRTIGTAIGLSASLAGILFLTGLISKGAPLVAVTIGASIVAIIHGVLNQDETREDAVTGIFATTRASQNSVDRP